MVTDEELIEKIYRQSLEVNKPVEIKNWSTWYQWMNSTHQLSYHGQLIYRITSFENQVLNGGFIQYFDNRYGIYAYELLEDLVEIGAEKTWKLLSKALLIINPHNFSNEKYFDFIYSQQYSDIWESIAEQFEQLDTAFYDFDDVSKPFGLLASYLRKSYP